MPLCANVLQTGGKNGSRGGGNLTVVPEVPLGIAQQAASATFSVGGTPPTPEEPFGCVTANSLLTLLRVTCMEGNIMHVP